MKDIPTFDLVAAVHPKLEDVEEYSLSWMSETGLLNSWSLQDRWRRNRLGAVVCHVYPFADFENLKLYSCWYSWWFYMDQLLLKLDYPEWAKLALNMEQILWQGGETGHRDPILGPLAELCRRTTASSSPDLYQWLAAGCCSALDGFNAESFDRSTGRLPQIGEFENDCEYLQRRRKTFGMQFDAGLVEHSLRFTVPAELRRSGTWQQALATVFDIIVLHNDINGFAQDLAEREVNNAVYLSCRQNGLEVSDAVDRIKDVIDEKVSNFLAVEQEIPETALRLGLSAEQIVNAADIIAKMKLYTQGALSWYQETDRYSGVVHPL